MPFIHPDMSEMGRPVSDVVQPHSSSRQGYMQDENVACRDLGKVLFEYVRGRLFRKVAT